MKKEIDFYKIFRHNLQLLRVERGLSAAELSAKLGMTANRITDLEYGKHGRGKPKSNELFAIAKFFGTTAEAIVFTKARVIF